MHSERFLKEWDFRHESLKLSRFNSDVISEASFRKLFGLLRVTPHANRLRRIGGRFDGGYLIPDCLDGVTACLSPGVARIASFENDLQILFGIPSHLADYSVEGPPGDFVPASFLKKFVGASDSDTTVTLESWVAQVVPSWKDCDLLLQMDIEGAEYYTLLSCGLDLISRFRVVVIELHDLHYWLLPALEGLYTEVLNRLRVFHDVVHFHPNNYMPQFSIYGVTVPSVVEITLLRRDFVAPSPSFTEISLPHELDSPNIPWVPDVLVDRFFY